MKVAFRRSFKRILFLTAVTVCLYACQKRRDSPVRPLEEKITASANKVNGATQISGLGFWDATDGCNSAGQGADFALTMSGDLEGCLYVFVDDFECSPSGTYREAGRSCSLVHTMDNPAHFVLPTNLKQSMKVALMMDPIWDKKFSDVVNTLL